MDDLRFDGISLWRRAGGPAIERRLFIAFPGTGPSVVRRIVAAQRERGQVGGGPGPAMAGRGNHWRANHPLERQQPQRSRRC